MVVRRRRTAVFASGAVALGLVLAGTACESRASSDRDRQVYAVYSELIRHDVVAEGWAGHPDQRDERRPIEQLVIALSPDPQAPATVSEYARAGLPSLSESTIRDFERWFPAPPMQERFDGIGPYVLLDDEELAGELTGWRSFYDRFPGAPGVIAFSQVGFNDSMTEALVYMMHLRDGLWGEGTLYLLRRTDDAWRVVETVSLWQA